MIDPSALQMVLLVLTGWLGAVAEYVAHNHEERNHQGLDNRLIAGTLVIDIASRVRRYRLVRA